MNVTHADLLRLFEAAAFAAEQHRFQRRNGFDALPYINHLIKVALVLMEAGETDMNLLVAAILHDLVEDTETTHGDLTARFGKKVADIVIEVTDDMTLPYSERKRLQLERSISLSEEAKKIRIADKLCNIRDIISYPLDWTPERKMAYIEWSEQMMDRLRGLNPKLEAFFDEAVKEGKNLLDPRPHET